MATTLFVGGISFNTSEDTLREAFERAGTVLSAKIIMDKITGRSRGFGFIDMENEEAANAAIAMWDGQELDGRRVGVKLAEPRTPNRGGYSGGGDM